MTKTTRTHGMSHTLLYKTWGEMKRRCENPKDPSYYKYGERGIKFCERWRKFENFYEDMGEKPSAIHSLDRIDVNGDYEPGNVRWALPKEQGRNKRNNRRFSIYKDGEWTEYALSELSELFNMPRLVIHKRLKRGWKLSEALLIPADRERTKSQPAQYKSLKCKVAGCKRPFRAMGYCTVHYAHVRAYGETHFGDWRGRYERTEAYRNKMSEAQKALRRKS